MTASTIFELERKMAGLDERMNTRQVEQESAIDRLRADMANWKTDMTQRENRLMLAMLGAVGMGTAILGVLITLN